MTSVKPWNKDTETRLKETRDALGLALTVQPSFTTSGVVQRAHGHFTVTLSLYRAENLFERPWYLVYTIKRNLPGKMETWAWGIQNVKELWEMDLFVRGEEEESKLLGQVGQFMVDYKGF